MLILGVCAPKQLRVVRVLCWVGMLRPDRGDILVTLLTDKLQLILKD